MNKTKGEKEIMMIGTELLMTQSWMEAYDASLPFPSLSAASGPLQESLAARPQPVKKKRRRLRTQVAGRDSVRSPKISTACRFAYLGRSMAMESNEPKGPIFLLCSAQLVFAIPF